MNQERLHNILAKMTEKKVSQLLVSDPTTIFYLTGEWIHPGERLLVLMLKANGEHVLFLNKLFTINNELGIKIVYLDDTDDGVGILSEYLDETQGIAVDKVWPAHFLIALMKVMKKEIGEIALGSDITDAVRARKSAEEIELMREASKDNDEAMKQLIALIPEKLTELEMTDRLKEIYRQLGNSGVSFDPIVAYGANGADPHHMTDDSVVTEGDSIILDIGGVKNDYCSDMTRTVFYQSVSDRHRDIYNIVLEANRRAIEAVKPGVKFSDIDGAARDYITEKGYGEYFTHRTGHFIGLECHEAGDVSAVNTSVVAPGMIFSIEPGIYLPGEVGVRIEDLVVATETGYENLNHFPKDLMIVGENK
ncbi:M24 family metallopeptidase [Vagococcus elongatus]|uniref:Peptidase M24 family protein n=1 Tax=Vagococcus elongatus TaxID=180344 RepID=A0A430AP14_9ENTE|nr:Xaa-Pro peptidase family protein [Vagococcus elongatus]RSU09815.1 peptidase M24 family protein [Vagococcus elongatus]